MKDKPLFISIEGVIGVGKTTLANAIASKLGAIKILEEDLGNPYLASFYKNKKKWAFLTQMFFLSGRLKQLGKKEIAKNNGISIVTDHTYIKDKIFAVVNLSDDEFDMHEIIYNETIEKTQKPEIVIYLKASIAELLNRIKERNKKFEKGINTEYLKQLINEYDQEILSGNAAQKTIIIDNDGYDLTKSEQAIERIIENCKTAPDGISYLNPT